MLKDGKNKSYGVRSLLLASAAALVMGAGTGVAVSRGADAGTSEGSGDKATTNSLGMMPSYDPFESLDPGRDLFDEMTRMRQEMDRTFQRAFSRFGARPTFSDLSRETFQQSMNVRDEKDKYVVEVDLPDQNVSNVNVTVENGMLKISAAEKKETNQQSVDRKEHRTLISNFQQQIALPENVDGKKMKVDRERGRLVVTIPKT